MGLPMLTQSWDCHTHVLDPARFPYQPRRKYTPAPAPLEALIKSATADNIVIVQATPEAGEEGLIHHLQEARTSYPDRSFRGTIVADTALGRDIRYFDAARVARLHSAGVRSMRLQGVYSDVAAKRSAIQEYLVGAATCFPVAELGWTISMQHPLEVWAELHDFLVSEPNLANVTIIADHNGSAKPGDIESSAFKSFLDLLRKRPNTYVKIGALHRRAPKDFRQMKSIVEAFAAAAPRALLWGSDWPHVDTTYPAFESAPHIESASGPAELQAIRSWLSEEQFHLMMVETPARLFS